MPYTSNYNISLPDVGEARLDAMQAMIIASLDDLNASLNRDAQSPLTFTSAQVIIGDPEMVTVSTICVCGGGKQDATDMELGQGGNEFMPRTDSAAPHIDLSTNIYVYISQNDMIPAPSSDTIADAQKAVLYREKARARIVGHLRRRVFNSQAASCITLASQEFSGSGANDQILNARITSIKLGMSPKGTGGSLYLYSANLLHEGYLQ